MAFTDTTVEPAPQAPQQAPAPPSGRPPVAADDDRHRRPGSTSTDNGNGAESNRGPTTIGEVATAEDNGGSGQVADRSTTSDAAADDDSAPTSEKAKKNKKKSKKKSKSKGKGGTGQQSGKETGKKNKKSDGRATKGKKKAKSKKKHKKVKGKKGKLGKNDVKRAGAGDIATDAGPLDATAPPMVSPLSRIQEELDRTADELERVQRELSDMQIRQEREDLLIPYQVELLKLQRSLEAGNQRMIVLFEGRDAAGKGGTIRRVTRYMNEKHYRVVALGKPTEEQQGQWYLQRYVTEFPRGGEMVLFDRSWYNRAMVEPIFGFCTQKEYEDFLRGVVGFEKDLVRQETILVKLYFSVSKREQEHRFNRRKTDPLRRWKLSEIDMQAQEHWDDFTRHKYEMLRRTHTSQTPWTIIRSGNKGLARLNAMKVILNQVDYEGRNENLDFAPDPDLVLSGAHEVEIMEGDRLRKGKFRA